MSDVHMQASGLAVGFNRRTVVREVSTSVRAGELVLVIGHNGSGKSTMLRTLYGLLPPVAGSATVLGHVVGRSEPRELLLAGVRYLAQGPRHFGRLRVRDSRRLLSALWGIAEPTDDLARGPDPSREVGELSLGQRKLEAVRLLSAGQPSLFLLDEPTAGLDAEHRELLFRWVAERRQSGAGFLVVEQEFAELLPIADKCVVLRSGVVSYSGSARALDSPDRLSSVFL